jgi:hypothetical protein
MTKQNETQKMELVLTDEFFDSISDFPVEDQQAIIDQITEMFNSGTLMEESESVDFDELPEELQAQILSAMDEVDEKNTVDKKRVLN